MNEGIARIVRHPVSVQEENFHLNCDSGHCDGYWNRWYDGAGELGPCDLILFHVPSGNGRGPSTSNRNCRRKIFASVMAFFSIGAAISAITFTFGPLFGSILKEVSLTSRRKRTN